MRVKAHREDLLTALLLPTERDLASTVAGTLRETERAEQRRRDQAWRIASLHGFSALLK